MQGDMEGSRIPARHRGGLPPPCVPALPRPRCSIAAALRHLSRAGRRRGSVPGVLVKLSFIAPPYCERLGTRSRSTADRACCPWRRSRIPVSYHRARAAVRYDDLEQARPRLEIRRPARLAPTMGRWMASAGRELLADADAIVPVPLHWRRQWMRRFNQSALLAKSSPRRAAGWWPTARSKRVKDHAPGRSRQAERAENVRGAFSRAGWRQTRLPGENWCWSTTMSHVGGDRGRLCADAAAGQRRLCRCAGIRPGCGGGPRSHIKPVGKVLRFT
jgi:predicted amidophosphoribosyltransferase